MGKSGVSFMIGVPLAVAAAALFICTEQVFPKSQIFLALYF